MHIQQEQTESKALIKIHESFQNVVENDRKFGNKSMITYQKREKTKDVDKAVQLRKKIIKGKRRPSFERFTSCFT